MLFDGKLRPFTRLIGECLDLLLDEVVPPVAVPCSYPDLEELEAYVLFLSLDDVLEVFEHLQMPMNRTFA